MDKNMKKHPKEISLFIGVVAAMLDIFIGVVYGAILSDSSVDVSIRLCNIC